MGEVMQNVRTTIATVAVTTVLVGLCAFVGAGSAAAAPSAGDGLAVSAAGIPAQAADGTNDESWH
ncbi:hypothetical protein [Streptomyces sp. NBC_00683]|uniref:hypothetical protein n=1 Tax=unclassified Streptomyces TaxID=2593676 RepID=UPI002E3049AB|nr:hypothetical protein [Streptomyces sp. NBC_00683]